MKLLLSLSILFTLSLAQIEEGSTKNCSMNKTYSSCGSMCELTCETISTSSTGDCPMVCIPKCVCKIGTVLNNNGSCVLIKDC